MGRRALPKLDATLDLSRYLVRVEDFQQPFDATAHFGRTAPLEIEIGSGKGLFLTRAAQTFPAHDFVGIEIARAYAAHCAARLAKAAVSNALMLSGDGVSWVERWVPDASVSAFHIYFPDPWWKARHRKRRVVNERLLRSCARTLKPGGRIHFWTDVQEYYETSLELFASLALFEGPFPVAESEPTGDMDYRTHFERRMRQAGKPIYRCEFVQPLVPRALSQSSASRVSSDPVMSGDASQE